MNEFIALLNIWNHSGSKLYYYLLKILSPHTQVDYWYSFWWICSSQYCRYKQNLTSIYLIISSIEWAGSVNQFGNIWQNIPTFSVVRYCINCEKKRGIILPVYQFYSTKLSFIQLCEYNYRKYQVCWFRLAEILLI